MEAKKILKLNKEIIFLYIIFFVGIIGHIYPPFQKMMIAITPITLLLTGFIVLYFSYKTSENNFLLWVVLTFIITFILEVTGVKTGSIFGSYSYGSTLGFKLFEVPLIIGFNWVLVILGSISFSKLITNNVFISSIISAIIAFIFDLILEPIAIKLDYWTWAGVVIPIQNYIAWFSIAFLSALAFNYLKINITSKISMHYLLVQYLFFIVLLIFYR